VTSIAFSPINSFIIASSSDNNTVHLWHATMKPNDLFIFEGHTETVTSVAFSPNGSFIVSGSWDKTTRLWDSLTGVCLAILEGNEGIISSAVFSHDGFYVVSEEERGGVDI
jgi:WD40 repeat protein